MPKRSLVLVLPGAMGAPEEPSVMRSERPGFARLAENGRVVKLAPNPPNRIPEAAYLGIKELAMAAGPLTVAAFGADPPAKSLQFHLSVLNANGQKLESATQEERDAILNAAKKLATRRLTVVPGDLLDHGLVLEETGGELRTTGPHQLEDWRNQLPAGDDEKAVRLFIDDSVNLLSELEINRRREDEGLPALNLLWPWGPGVRTPVPHLGLRHGLIANVFSSRIRMAGLTRLAGWKHADRSKFGEGTAVQFKWLKAQTHTGNASIVLLDSTWRFRTENRLEELDWLIAELDREFLAPLLEQPEAPAVTVLAPGPHGLALLPSPETGIAPFDERAFEERIPTFDIAEVVDAAIGAVDTSGPVTA